MTLSGRVALVTGGGRRVGQAIAIALGARGMRVAVHFNRSREGADETVRAIRDAGGEAQAFGADLTDASAIPTLVASVMAQFGAFDALVNSAAVMERTPFGEVSAEVWDGIMALNLRAPFLLAQSAAPHLTRASGGGVVVNIADLAAFETWPGYIPHGVSKAGVVYLTRTLARVMAPSVRVNGIAPGTVLLPEGWPNADEERLRATTPLGRTGTPADVANTVIFLLESDYLTGETIIVDGGRHVR
jgi:pteridine reductase